MRLLLTADLHFRLHWFRWLIEQAPDFDLVCIAGDLLDMFRSESRMEQAREIRAFVKELADIVRSCFFFLALAFGALAFQSCEVYPNGTSRGYNHGDGYVGDQPDDGYYGGGGVVVSSGYSEHHGYGYNNGYYTGENAPADRNVNVNRTFQTNRNVNVNRSSQVNRNVHVNRNAHGKPKVHSNPNTVVRKQ